MEQIKAEIKNLENILCDRVFFYQIPDYQRAYAWDKEQLSNLVDDLVNAYQNNNNEHYFCGSLVLIKNNKDERYDVIDGQQRITTFIILSCVLRDFYGSNLGEKASDYINEAIQDRYKETKRKLTLLTDENHQNTFEQEVLKKIKLDEKPRKSIEKKYPNNKYLQNAHYLSDFIAEKVGETKENGSIDPDDFVNWMFENTVLTTIICSSQDTAIQIFNVLNDRGMELTSVDILKSSLMRGLLDEDRRSFKATWDNITQRIKENDLSMEGLFTAYLYYTITSNPEVTLHKELLETFGNKNAMEIIHELEKFSGSYIAILTKEDNYIYCLMYLRHAIFWQAILTTADYKDYQDIEELKRIFSCLLLSKLDWWRNDAKNQADFF